MSKFMPYVHISINATFFTLFWVSALGNEKLIVPFFLFALFLLILIRDFFIANILLLSSFAILVTLIQFNFFNDFFIDKNIYFLYTIFILVIFSTAIVFRYLGLTFESKNRVLNISNYLQTIFLLMVSFIFFQQLDSLNPQKALKFLSSTGEDNAVWLSNLAQGINEDGGLVYQNPEGSNTRVATSLMLFIFRDFINFDSEQNLFLNNLLVLQRSYLILIAFGSMIAGLFSYRIFMNAKLSVLQSFVSSNVVTLSVYLSISSFNLYGHFPPIQSLILVFALFSLIFMYVSGTSKSSQKNFIFLTLVSSLLIAIGSAWYPLQPAVFISIFLLFGIQVWPFIKRRIKKNHIEIGLVTLFIVILIATRIQRVNDFLYANYSELRFLVHFAGGTMAPSDKQLLAFFIFCAFLLSGKLATSSKNDDFFNSTFLKVVFLSMISWYLIIVLVSITSPPHTVDYAGQKLGLFLVCTGLPLLITYLSLKFFKSAGSFLPSVSFLLVSTYLLVSIGPPTSPSNPAWTQFGFPFGLINGINSREPLIWETALVDSINNSQGKRVLCFGRNITAIEPFTTATCTKFAAGIQGFQGDAFTEFWFQANLNAVSVQEFQMKAPSDFEQDYEILILDKILPSGEEGEINQLSEYLGIK